MRITASRFIAGLALVAAAPAAFAENVLVLSSGDAQLDALVASTLRARDHSVTIGPEFHAFDGSMSVAAFGAVYIQANANWFMGDMPQAGQTALLDWASTGGGIVTSEWVGYLAASGRFANLSPSFAFEPTGSYRFDATGTYAAAEADPVMSLGLPASFQFPITDYGGTESFLVPRQSATVFYSTRPFGETAAAGVVGSAVGGGGLGRIVHLSTTFGPDQLNDPNCSQLLSNAVQWASSHRVSALVLSSGDAAMDAQVASILAARGITTTIGPEFSSFDGAPPTSLADFDVVYLQANSNWPDPPMPTAGQNALLNWISAGGSQGGGGLVTCEWTGYLAPFSFQTLAPALPFEPSTIYRTTASAVYTMATSDPIVSAGLPGSFEFALTSFTGTEGYLVARTGATTFYSTADFGGPAAGVVGWGYGSAGGRVISLSTTAGPNSLANPDFARLLGNLHRWAMAGEPTPPACPGDFNADDILNSQDFFDFLTAFFASDPTADFNTDGATNSQDFFDFLAAFFAGC